MAELNQDNINFASQADKAKNMKFLFIFNKETTADSCCCGCSLRIGTQILTALSLFGVVNNIYQMNSSNKQAYLMLGNFYYFATLIIGLFQLVSNSLIISSTFNNRFDRAYIGIILYQIAVIGSAFVIVVLPFIGFHDLAGEYTQVAYVTYFVIMIPTFLLNIYFLYVIFSFVKELGVRNFVKIDGLQVVVVPTNYQNNLPQGGIYIPGNAVNDFSQGYAQGQPVYMGNNQPNQIVRGVAVDDRSVQLQQFPQQNNSYATANQNTNTSQ